MMCGEYTCPFITKLSIIAELKEYVNKEIKAKIYDIRQEVVLLKQTSRQLRSAATSHFQQWIGFGTLLLYPIHWLATVLGESDRTKDIMHLN